MGISASDQIPWHDQALFRQENVLNAGATNVVKTHTVLAGELPAPFYDFGALDILGRCEVVHHQNNFLRVEDARTGDLFKLIDREHTGEFRRQDKIYPRVDELARVHFILITLRGEDFFGQRMPHTRFSNMS